MEIQNPPRNKFLVTESSSDTVIHHHRGQTIMFIFLVPIGKPPSCATMFYIAFNNYCNKKLRYREEYTASVVLSWCTL